MTITLPAAFVAYAARGPEFADWLDRLPALLRDWSRSGSWASTASRPTASARSSYRYARRAAAGGAQGRLAALGGRARAPRAPALARPGAVQLLRADPRRFALLLERLHREDLGELWDVEACEIVGGLYERLHVPAPPQLVTLSSCVRRWSDELAALPRDAPLPRRLVEQAVSLGRGFATDEAPTAD